MVEYTGRGYAQWWAGDSWSSDCHAGLQFNSSDECVNFITEHTWDVPVDATEHIFMSSITAENMKKSDRPDGIPRRAYMPEWVPAEKAVQDAVDEVEKMPADIRLTEAVMLLGQARDKVADYIDSFPKLSNIWQ